VSDVQMTYWHTVPMTYGTVEEMEPTYPVSYLMGIRHSSPGSIMTGLCIWPHTSF